MLGMYLTFCILCPWILKIESPLRHTQSLCVNRCVVRLHFFGRRPALLSALFFSHIPSWKEADSICLIRTKPKPEPNGLLKCY